MKPEAYQRLVKALTSLFYEVPIRSHQITKRSHHVTKRSHQITKRSHRVSKRYHQATKRSHQVIKRSHQDTMIKVTKVAKIQVTTIKIDININVI